MGYASFPFLAGRGKSCSSYFDFAGRQLLLTGPGRLLNMVVFVGMFCGIQYHVSTSAKSFCVCVSSMSYHDQCDPPLIAQGAPNKLTKQWYLVLQAWYLIKTKLQVLISTVFVHGGSTFIPVLFLNQARPVGQDL